MTKILDYRHERYLGKPVYETFASLKENKELQIEIVRRNQAEESLRRIGEETKRLVKEASLLAEIGRIINSTLNIEEVYDLFAKAAHKLIPFDRIIIALLNSDLSTVTNLYISGIGVKGRGNGAIYPLQGSIVDKVISQRAGIVIQPENVEEINNKFPSLASTFQAGLRSMISVPLISRDRGIGALHVRSKKTKAYTDHDLSLAERIADQIAGAVANAQLFSEHERAEKALRESTERYRNILDNIEEGYYEVDLRGNFTFFSDSLCKILGYSREELMGMDYRKYMDKETAQMVYQTFNQVYTTGEPNRGVNWEVIRKDGTKRIHESSVSLIKDAKGEPVWFRGIVRDVTERKKAEEEKRSLEEQLRQSQKMEAIGRLAGGIAHDFNNFLTVMRGHSQLALMELKKGDRFKESFEAIENATTKSANLVRQLLAFSRRQVMEMIVLDLNTLLKDLEKMLRRIIGEDVELLTVSADDLGRVKADPGQIEQVVLNLVVNARDAMPSGGKLTIETANVELDETYVHSHVAVTPGRYVMLSVSDTGVGMTPEVKKQVFDPFFTTKKKGKGTGLGLATAYGIVKQSGGNIWIYSEPGQGATFKIYLPRVEEPLTEEREKEVSGLFRGVGVILVVEDEEDVRKAVLGVFRKHGYSVLEAADEEDALLICQQYEDTIHLMVTDVVMPRISGPELAKRLVVFHPEMKVLYMSGYADEAIVHHGVLDKGVNYIQKPFTFAGLARKVREVLDKDTNPAI